MEILLKGYIVVVSKASGLEIFRVADLGFPDFSGKVSSGLSVASRHSFYADANPRVIALQQKTLRPM